MLPVVLFPLVIAGHLIGDWVVQTDWQAANKTTSWKAMAQHMVGYHLTLIVLCGWVLDGPGLAVLIAGSLATHAVIDRRWPVIRLMEATGSGPFAQTGWGVMCVDQALHLSTLAVLAAILG